MRIGFSTHLRLEQWWDCFRISHWWWNSRAKAQHLRKMCL